MRWVLILPKIADAIETDDDAVAILGPEETQALYYEGNRAYRVPSMDILMFGALKDEVMEPFRVQFNKHAESFPDLVELGDMLERLFDRDTWYTLGGIYLRSTKVEDGPLSGPDKHGVFHQPSDYEFEAVRSKYATTVSES